LAALLSTIPLQKFGAKRVLLAGQYGMVVWLYLIVAFNELDISMGLILSMMFFLVTYQLSLGPIAFIHFQETCTNSALGVANMNCFF